MDLTALWNAIKDALLTFGFVKGLFLITFLGGHYWIFRMYDGRLGDRQKEIDRLAEDNREYRERFLSVLDKHFNLPPREPQKRLPEAKKRKEKRGSK